MLPQPTPGREMCAPGVPAMAPEGAMPIFQPRSSSVFIKLTYVMPDWHVTVPLVSSISRISFIRNISTVMPPLAGGVEPASCAEPPPCGTMGTLYSLAIFTISATSSVVLGRTTRFGTLGGMVPKSLEYALSTNGLSETYCGPTTSARRLRIAP